MKILIIIIVVCSVLFLIKNKNSFFMMQEDLVNKENTELAVSQQKFSFELIVKGMSYLQPGDVVQFNIISVENKEASDGRPDPQFAGRYIISKIRHRVTFGPNGDYIQKLECVKDSVYRPYSKGDKSYQADRLIREKGSSLDVHKYDDLADDLAAGRPIRL